MTTTREQLMDLFGKFLDASAVSDTALTHLTDARQAQNDAHAAAALADDKLAQAQAAATTADAAAVQANTDASNAFDIFTAAATTTKSARDVFNAAFQDFAGKLDEPGGGPPAIAAPPG
ncbi:MAG TPA: hypothetical protein VIU64_06550 [Polyangia bacterium]